MFYDCFVLCMGGFLVCVCCSCVKEKLNTALGKRIFYLMINSAHFRKKETKKKERKKKQYLNKM